VLRVHLIDPGHGLLAGMVATFNANDERVPCHVRLNAHVNFALIAGHQIGEFGGFSDRGVPSDVALDHEDDRLKRVGPPGHRRAQSA
jgi:hypothetical protein